MLRIEIRLSIIFAVLIASLVMPLSEARADYTCLVDEIRAQIRATFETSLIRFFQDRERSPCSQRLCRDLEVLEVDPWSRIPKAERENIQRNYVYMQDVLSHALDIESSDKELRLDLLRRMFLRNPNIFYQTELPRGLAMFVTNSSSAVPSTLSFLERLGLELMSPNPRRANSVRSLLDALISSRYLDGPAEGDAHAVSRALGQAEVTRALTVSSPRDIAAKRELYQRNRANPQQWENFNDRVSGRTSLLPSRPREQPAHRNVPPPAPTPAPLHISPPWTLARRPGLNTPWVTTGGTSTIRVPDEARLVLEGAERDFQISVAASPLVTGYRVREECYQGSAGGQFMVVRRIHSPSIDGGRFTRSEPMVSGQAFFYNASLDRMEALPQYNERQHSFPWLSGGTGIDPRSPQRIVYRVLNVADAARLRSNPGMAIRAADPGNGIVTPHIHVSRARGYESSPYISATRDLNTAIQWASAANCTGCMVVAIDLSRIAPQFQNSNNIVDLTNPSIREAQVFGAFPRNFAEASAEVLLKDSDRNQPLLPANAYDIVFDTLLPHTTPLNVTREQMLGEVTRNQSNY